MITVVMPCAGEGTRLALPYPKEIFSIEKHKSLIDYTFDLFADYGRNDVQFVITMTEDKTDLVKYLSSISIGLIYHLLFLILVKQNILDHLRVQNICLEKRILFFYQILISG